jgi:hypothetical protein
MEKPPFQFSLAALLLTVAAIAGVLALTFRVAGNVANLSFVALLPVSLAFLTIGIVYGHNCLRPFCIGAAFPLVMAFGFVTFSADLIYDSIWPVFPTVEDNREPSVAMKQRIFGAAFLSSIVIGYLCVGFRWLIVTREPPDA